MRIFGYVIGIVAGLAIILFGVFWIIVFKIEFDLDMNPDERYLSLLIAGFSIMLGVTVISVPVTSIMTRIKNKNKNN